MDDYYYYIYRHAVLECESLQCVRLGDRMFDTTFVADKVCIVTYAAIFSQRFRITAYAYPFVHLL